MKFLISPGKDLPKQPSFPISFFTFIKTVTSYLSAASQDVLKFEHHFTGSIYRSIFRPKMLGRVQELIWRENGKEETEGEFSFYVCMLMIMMLMIISMCAMLISMMLMIISICAC